MNKTIDVTLSKKQRKRRPRRLLTLVHSRILKKESRKLFALIRRMEKQQPAIVEPADVVGSGQK